MPARETAGLGEDDPGPNAGRVQRLLAQHPRGLPSLAMPVTRPDDARLLLGPSVFLLGLPALVLCVKLRPAPRDPVPNALARRGIRRQRHSVAMTIGALKRYLSVILGE